MASDVNSIAAKRAGFKIQFRPSKEDLEKIAAIASELPKKMRKKIVRKGLRNWGDAVKRTMKALALPKAKRTKRDIAVKTKTYRKGIIWAGVGVRKDGNRVGKRSHFYDQADTGMAAIETAINSGSGSATALITLSSGMTYSGAAFVQSFSATASTNEIIRANFTIQYTGTITIA